MPERLRPVQPALAAAAPRPESRAASAEARADSVAVDTGSALPARGRPGPTTARPRFDGLRGVDVVESKLRIPRPPPTSVSRTPLVNRLRAAGAFPTVLVVAPAGYGKTTLLAQWAARDVRPFAWVSLDDRDNDATVLLRHVVAAIDRVEPLPPSIVDAVRDSRVSIWDVAIPRLTARLAPETSSFVLVLDDAHLLESTESVAVVRMLIENVPPGSMIVLAGRATPKVSVAALRVRGPLLEIGPYELSLSRREAELLLRSCGVELQQDELLDLLERTEGWAAGVYLAALAAREGTSPNGDRFERVRFTGDDRYLADYFDSEYLSRTTPDLLRFLRRTSVLDEMCAPLCDFVLESTSSAAQLELIERAKLFVVALDRNRSWFRYHPLFRDLLRRELERHEPQKVRALHERAAEWHEAHSDPESALAHARAAGDSRRAARLLSSIASEVRDSGRAAALEGSLEYFDEDGRLERHQGIAALGSSIHALLGRPEEADRWLRAAERGAVPRRRGVASARLMIATVRSLLCPEGPEQMDLDARTALAKLPRDDRWRPWALLTHGAAAIFLGRPEHADSIMTEAAAESARLGCTETRALALAERSLLAAVWGDHARADEFALEAHDLVEAQLGHYATSALAIAVSGRALLRQGQWDAARARLTTAERLTAQLTSAIPWLAVQARLELGNGYAALRDRDGARCMLEEARRIVSVRPGLGELATALAAFDQAVTEMPDETGPAGFTPAELRLLPLLSTHLSFREIGERLYLSPHTVKTQAISIYRKLGVSSRSAALACAGELGLIDAGVAVAAPPAAQR